MSFSRVVRAALSLALLLSVSVAAGAAVFVSSGDTVWRMDDGLTAIEAAQSGFTGVAALAAQPIRTLPIGWQSAALGREPYGHAREREFRRHRGRPRGVA